MLVFKEFENNEFSILDTEDNVIESISGEELLNILCTTDLEIHGLSLNNKGFVVDDTKTVLYKPVKVKNSNLTKAKKAKNDEFYTQLPDIEKELSHYPIETFKDKVIYCPMDVATNTGKILQSQFVKYFQLNAHRLKFKKLIATCLVDKAAGDGVDSLFSKQDFLNEIIRLQEDDEVTSRVGIYDYVLSGNERKLSTRKFPDKIKIKKYKQQGGKCALCQRPFSIDGMTADHITPWSQGGKTVEGNCQVLCVECNSKKSAKKEVAMNEIICKNCGKPVKPGMFCQFCGTRN